MCLCLSSSSSFSKNTDSDGFSLLSQKTKYPLSPKSRNLLHQGPVFYLDVPSLNLMPWILKSPSYLGGGYQNRRYTPELLLFLFKVTLAIYIKVQKTFLQSGLLEYQGLGIKIKTYFLSCRRLTGKKASKNTISKQASQIVFSIQEKLFTGAFKNSIYQNEFSLKITFDTLKYLTVHFRYLSLCQSLTQQSSLSLS